MIRVEEAIKLVHVEIKHLREDFTAQTERVDKRFNSLQWLIGVLFTVISILISIRPFLS